MKNEGKIFEDAIKSSVPDTCWIYRLRDNAASFAGGQNTRFTSTNICDYITLHDPTKTLFLWELKSTKGTSMTFWKETFEDKEKNQTFMIKKNQIKGLREAAKHNLVAGFLLNFRNENNSTFFIDIDTFLSMSEELIKKSFNIQDLIDHGAIYVESKKKKTRFIYDIENLIRKIHL